MLPRLLRASCRASDAVFCLNRAEVEYLTRHHWVDPTRICLVSNSVERDLFLAPDHRPVARRLLFVGQWLPAKGTRYLVHAFSALAARRDVELVCVGTGVTPDVVAAAFPDAVRSRVAVRPRLDRVQLAGELQRADVFVFPSLSEGFSVALLEAMAAGLAIVATPAGAAADLLEHGGNALLVPCADAAALADGVERMLDDAPLRQRLGSAAQQRAATFESARVNVEFTTRLLDVVQSHAASQGPHAAIDDAVA